MSTLKSATFLLVIYLIFINRAAVQSYDIKRLENAMHHMAKRMEEQRLGITYSESKHILNEFIKFGEYVASETNKNPANTEVISGTSGKTYSIYFDFTPQKRD